MTTKRIPIVAAGASVAAACGDAEASGEVPKLDLPLVRREFLKGSGVLVGTIPAASVLAALAPSPVWAVELKTLSKPEAEALMKMARVLYPHKRLPDAVYALVAKDLDGAATKDAGAAKTLRDGVVALDQAAGGSFVKASDAKKTSAVKSLQGSAFFGAVRGQCITSLYDNDMAYKAFGYPGASFDKGGYITRGFQDLKWLPAPPDAASPKAYMG